MQSVKITCSLGISTRNTHKSIISSFLLLFDPLSRFFSICSCFPCYMYVSIKSFDRAARQIDKALNKHIFLGAKTNWIVVVAGRCRSSSSFFLSSHHHITSRWSNLHTYDVFHSLCVILLVCVRAHHIHRERHTVKSNSRNRSIEEERISSVVDGEYTSRRRSLFNHHHHHL